jgi:hypothetical protein
VIGRALRRSGRIFFRVLLAEKEGLSRLVDVPVWLQDDNDAVEKPERVSGTSPVLKIISIASTLATPGMFCVSSAFIFATVTEPISLQLVGLGHLSCWLRRLSNRPAVNQRRIDFQSPAQDRCHCMKDRPVHIRRAHVTYVMRAGLITVLAIIRRNKNRPAGRQKRML